MSHTGKHKMAWAGIALAALGGCGGGDLPEGVYEISRTVFSATVPGAGTTPETQDLLTGGLGKSGIGATAAPAYANAAQPTALELRRNAIHSNYRALVDPTANGGYGRLYGPNIDLSGGDTLGEGMVPGIEYLARLDDGSGRKNVAIVVQIPDNFDAANPCIVAGPSSGSRGVYGAIGASADWGLKRGCAVALTDAGKGVGLYDPMDDTVNTIDGTRATTTAAGMLSHFSASITQAARNAFNAAFPNRLAVKHAHSQQNPEKDWGSDTLIAVRYAFYALNREYGPLGPSARGRKLVFHPANTIVIGGSVSNGGAAVLQAAEQDKHHLIDGVVAAEPTAQPGSSTGYGVRFAGADVAGYGKPLLDFFTLANVYQPCAVLAPTAAIGEFSFFNFMTLTGMNPRAANRCTALAAKGLVAGTTTAEQAADALAKLRAYGWGAEHDLMHNAHFGFGNAPIIAMMYTNAMGRFAMQDNLCGMSAAQVNAAGDVVPVAPLTKALSFAVGNGTLNGVPATPVYNDSVGGAKGWQFAVSPSTGTADFGLDAALCQRALVTGTNPVTGVALDASSVPTKAQSDAVRAGMAEVLLKGDLRRTPTVLVSGRSDALIPVNNASRAYAAFNRSVEGKHTQLRYYEVTNAQHFDTFVSLSGFDTRFVPLHPYFNQAMNAMYARLKSGTPLPPSQVVRTTPRGGVPGAAPAIGVANVPPLAAQPAAGDAIGFVGSAIDIPN